MTETDFPAPQSGFVVTHFLVVSDQDRSREFYRSVFGATVLLERDPVIMKIANSWLILNVGGGPTDDKPTVTLAPPQDPDHTSEIRAYIRDPDGHLIEVGQSTVGPPS